MAKKNKQQKSKNSTKRYQRHFRKFHNKELTGHPQYVYGDDGKNYTTVGITSSPVTNGVANIPLDKNPEPNNKDKAYIRPKPNKVNKGVRNQKVKGWKFADSDKPKVQKVIESDKKK